MITREIPDSWQDLQAQVARILSECGLDVEIEKRMPSVRGEVEIDVYAEEDVDGRTYRTAVECKYWNSRIPQNVIHGFRTVCADLGINNGMVVSMKGFQSGAHNASQMTNIDVLTWEDFQNHFLKSWYDGYFTGRIAELSSLMTYSEPFVPPWFHGMSDVDQKLFLDLKSRYSIFGMMAQSFGPWGRMMRPKEEIPSLPIDDRISDEVRANKLIPDHIVAETHYRHFLEAVLEHGFRALSEFRAFRDKYAKKD